LHPSLSLFDKRQIAQSLLAIGAVSLRVDEPYTWTSGIKSPIYCDNRLTLSHPILRSALADAFCSVLRANYAGIECIAGTATAGISHAALIADRLGLPMVYVRSSAKGHGKQNLIEGRVLKGQRVAVVEDTISTGGSALAAVAALRAVDAEVPLTLAIFSYGFAESELAFQQARVALEVLTDFPTLVEVAAEQGHIDPDKMTMLLEFQHNPQQYA